MKRRIPAVLAAATIGLGALIPAGDALAAASDCTPGVFCVWTGTNFTGGRKEMLISNSDWLGWAIWNGDNSAFNKKSASTSVAIYSDLGWSGHITVCVRRGDQLAGYSDHNNGESNAWDVC